MKECLSEATILDLAMGEGIETAREHTTACLACSRRVAAAREDLALLRAALEVPPAVASVRAARHLAAWRWWVPVAVATVAVLAIGLYRNQETTRAAAPAIADFAREVSRAVFADSRTTVAAATDMDYLQAALSGAAPCDPMWQRCSDETALTGY